MIDNDIAKALESSVKYYGEKVNAYLKQGKYPSGQDPYRKNYVPIEETEKIGEVEQGEGELSQTITYGSGKNAPYAVAYEFGSGVHGYKNPEKYIIAPKKTIRFHKRPGQRGKRMIYTEEKALAVGAAQFLRTGKGWKVANLRGLKASPKYAGDIFKDIYAMYFVEHPGIKPKPFAETVWLQEQQNIINKMGQDILAVIDIEINKL